MDDAIYMLGIVAVGFAVNFLLRALPFILFGRRSCELPKAFLSVCDYVSPVIVAGLVVYAYSGTAWRTAWPYVAGAVTVLLQVWRRNPLVSIVAGTAVYMALLATGCSSIPDEMEFDAEHPFVAVTSLGVTMGGQPVAKERVPILLEKYGVPKTRTIHVEVNPNELRDFGEAKMLLNYLRARGYTRNTLVTRRHGDSFTTGKRASSSVRQSATRQATRPAIRYKRPAAAN